MKTIKFIFPFIAIILAGISSCNKDKITPDINDGNCFSGKVIKSVRDQNGVVQYNSVEKRYAISIHLPGSIDAVDLAFLCEHSDVPKEDGVKVSFSGNYYSYSDNRKPPIGGMKYYFLDVTSYKVIRD